MKRLITALVCAVLLLSAAACGSESVTPEPTAAPTAQPTEQKKILKLESCPYLEIESTEPTVESVNIPYDSLAELNTVGVSDNPGLTVFVDHIRDKFGIDIDDNWHVLVHFYTDDMSCGMVEFQYYIGDIGTDRHFLFNLNNGVADQLYYANIDCYTDEQALKDAVAAFNAKYEQEKYQLKGDEELESETVSYTYNYKSGALVYCYNVFFYYGADHVINNDFGTMCFIDRNGDVVQRGA